MNSFRGGMQVHAVPDNERVQDARGNPLPWGYIYADTNLAKSKAETGPFGKPTKTRGVSLKSKTATPAPETSNDVQNQKAIDDIFTKFKKDLEEREVRPAREQKPPATTAVPHARSAIDLTQASNATAIPAPPAPGAFTEPSEVLIYGYGNDQQYAAIEYFESSSLGRIYEDYDRYPPNTRYNALTTASRPMIPRSLPPNVIRKINTFQGGNNWIKVTFDSVEAASRACFFSPHVIHGYLCQAEMWRGVGPNVDAPVFAHSASISPDGDLLRQRRGAPANQGKSWSSLPSRIHSAPLLTTEPHNQDMSSTSSTASSATATGNDTQALQPVPESPSTPSSTSLTRTPEKKPLKIPGATRAVLLPASQAVLPVAPWSQRTFGHFPIVGSLFGGDPRLKPGDAASGGIIGSTVPRTDEGKFDWARSSWYWRSCWWVDTWVGTDLCGLKGEE